MKSKLNVLFIGDIVGEPGIKICKDTFPELIEKYKPDIIIANGENASQGKGITEVEANILFELGVNIITTGNHVWDNWKSKPLLSKNNKVLRPLNYPPGNAGYGYSFHEIEPGKDVCVLHLQGRTFLQTIDCPFRAADYALKTINDRTKFVIVDFHAEATAEKMSMGWHLDGRVSAVIGTHIHIQTADATILPNGTAYISDVGMTGPYDSVVGMNKEVALKRFLYQSPHKYEIAENDVKICGCFVSIDSSTGQALEIEPFIKPPFIRSVMDEL